MTFRPRLIINQAREEEDIELGHSIAQMVNRHLGIKISFLGYLPYDERVFKSIKKFTAVHGSISGLFHRIMFKGYYKATP